MRIEEIKGLREEIRKAQEEGNDARAEQLQQELDVAVSTEQIQTVEERSVENESETVLDLVERDVSAGRLQQSRESIEKAIRENTD